MMTTPEHIRFFPKVQVGSQRYDGAPCLEWTASKDGGGYGQFRYGGGASAHRWLYERWVGPIPEGLELDHLCRNRVCCNPLHLEAVTHLENVRRGAAGRHLRAKTHCPVGHPFDGLNTYWHNGHRQCRACRNARMRATRARKKAA